MGDPFYIIFNGYFFLILAGLLFGFGGVLIKNCYQSKCKTMKICFGLINITRDIEAEEDIDLHKPKSNKDESKI